MSEPIKEGMDEGFLQVQKIVEILLYLCQPAKLVTESSY